MVRVGLQVPAVLTPQEALAVHAALHDSISAAVVVRGREWPIALTKGGLRKVAVWGVPFMVQVRRAREAFGPCSGCAGPRQALLAVCAAWGDHCQSARTLKHALCVAVRCVLDTVRARGVARCGCRKFGHPRACTSTRSTRNQGSYNL